MRMLGKLLGGLKAIVKARYIVAVLALALIACRVVWPNFKYDNTSFYLTLLAALVLLIPDIGDTIARIRRFQIGNVIAEFESRVADVEKAVDAGIEGDTEADALEFASDKDIVLSDDETQVLRGMAKSKWILRSARGLAKELGFTLDKIDRLLLSLRTKGCVSEIERATGPRWALTERGQKASSR